MLNCVYRPGFEHEDPVLCVVVTPRPERVYSTGNYRGIYVHQVPL